MLVVSTMVRNTVGGGSHKRCARKHNDTQHHDTRTVRRKGDGEEYAIVTMMSGGQHCQVMCADGQTRTCVIRKKFRGRGKRDNTLSTGVWLLVAPRDDWERPPPGSGKHCKCDLLEVYASSDRDRLISDPEGADLNALVTARKTALGEDPEELDITFYDSDDGRDHEGALLDPNVSSDELADI